MRQVFSKEILYTDGDTTGRKVVMTVPAFLCLLSSKYLVQN